MRRLIALLTSLVVLGTVQAVVSATATTAVPVGDRPPLSYDMRIVGDRQVELDLIGGGGEPLGIHIERLAGFLPGQPLRVRRSPSGGPRSYLLDLLGASGTYKVVVEGYEPFGLINVGR